MAITAVGSIGSANSKAASSTIVLTTTADAFAGDLIVVCAAWDNNNSASVVGPRSYRLAITDSVGGNTWDQAAGAEDATANARCFSGIAFCVLTNNLPAGSTITDTYVSSRTAKAITAHRFTLTNPAVRVYRVKSATDRAVDPSALTLDWDFGDGREVLLVHSLAGEGPETDTYTWDSDYTQFTGNGTTGSTADTNMHVRAGYRIVSGLTSDTVDVTSDTADRDYSQCYAVFTECQSVPTLPVLAAGTGFQYVKCVGWAETTRVATTTEVGPLDGCPVGSLVLVSIAWDNTNASSDSGPGDTLITATDTAGNTWTQEAAGQNANGIEAGSWASILSTVVTNQINPGNLLTVSMTSTARFSHSWTAHLFAIETPTTKAQAGRVHLHTDAADPGAITLSSLAVNDLPYLFFYSLAGEGPDTDAYTWDADYTQLTGFGNWESSLALDLHMHNRCGYRIAAITSDTVDVTSDTADRDYTQLLIALSTTLSWVPVTMRY